MDNSLKWVLFNTVSGQITSTTLWKLGEVFLLRIWLYFFIPKNGRKYSHTNSYNFKMTLISQDDHLPAGAWTACDWRRWKSQAVHDREEKKISLTDRATLPLIPLVNRTLSSRITASDMKVRRRNTKQWHTCKRCCFNTHLLSCAQLALRASPLRLPP